MRTAALALLLTLAHPVSASIAISGTVRMPAGEPLPGVTVWVDGATLTTITDAEGKFTLDTDALPAKVTAYLAGFDSVDVTVASAQPVDITLALSAMSESVTVSAKAPRAETNSSFDFRPLEILKTAGAQADIFRALQMMPGVAKLDEGAGLFVRGGDVSEVRVLLDGTTIAHPFRYETPSGGQFGTITPMLIEGLAFSTGGFSVRFGNALSAVLDLRGLGKPSSNQGLFTAGLAGASARASLRGGEDSGLWASGNITTTKLLFELNGAPRRFDQLPEGHDVNLSLHRSSSRFGNFKFFAMTQSDRVGVELQRDGFDGFLHSSSRQTIVATSWKKVAGEWQLASSLGANSYARGTAAGVMDVEVSDRRLSWRFDASRAFGPLVLRTGADADALSTRIAGTVSFLGGDLNGAGGTKRFDVDYRDDHGGAYVELERRMGRITPTLGMRVDRNRLVSGPVMGLTFDPRASVAVAVAHAQTVRVSWGVFHQSPAADYFDRDGAGAATRLDSMQAQHWILGWERGTADAPFFARIEAYDKRYTRLPLDAAGGGFTSDGYGFARGIDLFVQKRWRLLDLRASASVLDAERRWTLSDQRQRFELPAGTWSPDFDIPRTAGVSSIAHVTKTIDVGSTVTYASGRPHTPIIGAKATEYGVLPVYGAINSERLPAYVRADINATYRTSVGGFMLIYFAAVSNSLARENFSDYAYSADYTAREPIVSAHPRSFFFGFTISK